MATRRLKVLSAVSGRMVGGQFRKNPGRRNVAEGFHDANGVFHPIRHSSDYDGSRAGEGGSKKKKSGKKKKAVKAKTKKKAPKKKAKRAVTKPKGRKTAKKKGKRK